MRAWLGVILLLWSGIVAAEAESGPPYGLGWGMSFRDFLAAGGYATYAADDHGLDAYLARSIPGGDPDAEFFILYFWEKRLVRMAMATRDFVDDPQGASGKARYQRIKRDLTSSAGAPTKVLERVDDDNPTSTNLYRCLHAPTCGSWMSLFSTQDTTVLLRLRGFEEGFGYVELIAESTKQYPEALRQLWGLQPAAAAR
jgi:hypothetical protein